MFTYPTLLLPFWLYKPHCQKIKIVCTKFILLLKVLSSIKFENQSVTVQSYERFENKISFFYFENRYT
jgi:hypothetical protein